MQYSDFQGYEQAMNRHRRRVAHARNADQRVEFSERLQITAMKAIQSAPEAYLAFLVRNYRRRRKDEVERLLQELTRERK